MARSLPRLPDNSTRASSSPDCSPTTATRALRRITAAAWTEGSRAAQAALTEVLADALDALRRGFGPADPAADDPGRPVRRRAGPDGATGYASPAS